MAISIEEKYNALIEYFCDIYVSDSFFAKLLGFRPDENGKNYTNHNEEVDLAKVFDAAELYARDHAHRIRFGMRLDNDAILKRYLQDLVLRHKKQFESYLDALGDDDECDYKGYLEEFVKNILITLDPSIIHRQSGKICDNSLIKPFISSMKNEIEMVINRHKVNPGKIFQKATITKIVSYVYDAGKSTVNEWHFKEDGTAKVPSEKYRQTISAALGLKHEIWLDDFDNVENFKEAIPGYMLIPFQAQHPINDHFAEIGSHDASAPNCQKVTDISEEVLRDSNIEGLVRCAWQLKNEAKYKEALDLVEQLSSHPQRYRVYGQLLHLKAILLSTDTFKRFDEAIATLRILYFAMDYHLQDSEIVTLLASNLKRIALYNTNGSLREHFDEALLKRAESIYFDAYRLTNTPQYYNAINLAYLALILARNEEECKEAKERIESYYLEVQNGFDSNDLWSQISKTEFLLLQEKFSDAEEVWNRIENQLNADHKAAMKRQMELFVHFAPDCVGEIKNNMQALIG